MSVRILGIDPGFLNVGFALVEMNSGRPSVLRDEHETPLIGNLQTFAVDNKKVYQADDNIRRAREIYIALLSLIRTYQTTIIVAEAMSFPRNASTAHKMGLCWGVLTSLATLSAVPLLQVYPQQIKHALTGSRTASKKDVQAVLSQLYDVPLDMVKQTYREHAFDALGAVHSFLSTPKGEVMVNSVDPVEVPKLAAL